MGAPDSLVGKLIRRARTPIASRAWIWLAMRRRASTSTGRADLDESLQMSPEQEALVRRYAPGRSFADIGCLYKADGAIAFLAEEAGATGVTAFDEDEPSPAFEQRKESTRSAVRYVSGDLYDAEAMNSVGVHDVVWCSGVLYHAPDPFRAIERLRSIAREYLILGNKSIPELPGFPGGAVYLPGLTEPQRTAYAPIYPPDALRYKEHWRPYSNWWWGLTESAMRGMLEMPGWIVEDVVRRPWTHRFDDLLFVARRVGPGPDRQPV